ncbi:MAG: carbohydrate ABC transporter permease [Treponema lecithinolyticum]|uniref:carbohydrate ABC transporter permease n=1 Tax=Treponema lecithinolyticum TaxID=53418 RepID=UPI00360940A8
MITKNRGYGIKILFYTLGTVLTVLWLFPIAIAIFTAFKSMDEIMGNPYMWKIPHRWVFSNFVRAWTSAGMGRYVMNTFIITVPSLLGTLFVSSLGAFALAFYKFKLNRTVLIIFISGMLIPFQMLLIPVYRFSDRAGLINTLHGVILFHAAFQSGFCTFFLRNFMKQIPFSLIEVSRIDGTSEFTIYRRIILPLCVSSFAALSVLEFTWIWNDLLWALILLQSDKLKPVTLGLANMQGQYVTNYNMIASGSIIAAAVPLAVFLVFQRYFIDGMTVGAVKG